jgi:glycosyltransferase involved in cell wall biosynthesis
MYAFDDLTAVGKFGTFYEDNDPQDFAKALGRAASLSQIQGMDESAAQHGRAEFAWSTLIERLREKLNSDD